MKTDKRGLCSGCGKKHSMSTKGNLSLTKKGWWAYDLLRRQRAA